MERTPVIFGGRFREALLAGLFSIIVSINGFAQVATPDVVRTFYEGMVALHTRSEDVSKIGELEMVMRNCFYGHENSGMNLPNDFRYFDFDKGSASHNLDILTSNNYISKLGSYVPKGLIVPTAEIKSGSRKVGYVPSFSKGRMSESEAYIMTVVKKKFSCNDQTKEFFDTVYTHIQTNKILSVLNGNGAEAFDAARLKIEAAVAFERKNYYKAYSNYLKIIEHDKKDGESYYYLALMTFYGKGCKKSKKDAKVYLNYAIKFLPYYEAEKAHNVYKYWQYPNQ